MKPQFWGVLGVKMGAGWSRGQQSERRQRGLLEPRLCPSGAGVGDEQSQVQDGAAAASRQGQCLYTDRKSTRLNSSH